MEFDVILGEDLGGVVWGLRRLSRCPTLWDAMSHDLRLSTGQQESTLLRRDVYPHDIGIESQN